jgi:hypothetical protein
VPLFYTLLDDLRVHAGPILRSAFGRRAKENTAVTATTAETGAQ